MAYGVFSGYVFASAVALLRKRGTWTVERALMVAVALACGRVRLPAPVWRWIPAGLSPLMFSELRGFAAAAAAAPHVSGPIRADRLLLGGRLATPPLQRLLARHRGGTAVTAALAMVYLSFWASPLAMGVWLARRHPERFARFADAFMLLETSGFLIYFAYPEAPPWLAARRGAGPPMERSIVALLDRLGGWGPRYAAADPAPLRAMPAMHCAVPALIAADIIAARRGEHRYWLWLLYPACVGFGVLCLGEHYLIDVLAAFVLTGACLLTAECPYRPKAAVDG